MRVITARLTISEIFRLRTASRRLMLNARPPRIELRRLMTRVGRPKGTDATPRPRSLRTPPLCARTRRRLGRRTTPPELKLWPSPRETRPRARRSPRSSRPLWMMRTPCATLSAGARRRRDRPPIGVRSRPPSKPSLHLRPTSTRYDATSSPLDGRARRSAPHGSSPRPPASR